MIKRIINLIAFILILASVSGRSATAAEAAGEKPDTIETRAGSLLVESDSEDTIRYEDGRLHIYGGTVSVKTDSEVDYSTDTLEISGYTRLVLCGVKIKSADGAAIRILPGADVEIELASDEEEQEEAAERIIDNFLQGAEGAAGIEVGLLPGGEKETDLPASLRVVGNGFLTVSGGDGAAAIGSSRGQNTCGHISIEGGTIKAIAGNNADAIGCGEENVCDPDCAPVITSSVNTLSAVAGGRGRAIAPAAKVQEAAAKAQEPEKEMPAALLKAEFTAGENFTGEEIIRVRNTQDGSETDFTMPEDYRAFAVKVNADCTYMIEQGGRTFAAAESEDFSGEIEESDETDVLFMGTADADAEPVYLAPAQKAPSIDIDISGFWEDEENRDGTRPDSIIVTLYANGNETGRTLTLSEENDWSGTFEDLAVYSDSIKQCYCVTEERLEGYTGLISGSDQDGYVITNTHEPLPEGRSAQEEIEQREPPTVEEGKVVATVLTKKVSRSMPARTSTTIKKTRSVKTADASSPALWGTLLFLSLGALFIWMRIEQNKE